MGCDWYEPKDEFYCTKFKDCKNVGKRCGECVHNERPASRWALGR